MTDHPLVEVKRESDNLSPEDRPCMSCANGIVSHLVAEHGPTAALNTILAAARLFIEHEVKAKHRAEMLRAAETLFRSYAVEEEADQAGAAMGPAQGRA